MDCDAWTVGNYLKYIASLGSLFWKCPPITSVIWNRSRELQVLVISKSLSHLMTSKAGMPRPGIWKIACGGPATIISPTIDRRRIGVTPPSDHLRSLDPNKKSPWKGVIINNLTQMRDDGYLNWINNMFRPLGCYLTVLGISVKPVLKLVVIASAGAILARKG